jgi:hypothetical protein
LPLVLRLGLGCGVPWVRVVVVVVVIVLGTCLTVSDTNSALPPPLVCRLAPVVVEEVELEVEVCRAAFS